jgi:predicted ester cyclase
MRDEELGARAQRIMEGAYHRGELQGLAELYAADAVQHRPPLGDNEGLEAIRAYVADLRRTFSGIRLSVDQVIVAGDSHAIRWTFRGTHTGRSPAMPVPPTGREIAMGGCSVGHWRQGRIDEEWVYVDWLGLFGQLGVIPPTG